MPTPQNEITRLRAELENETELTTAGEIYVSVPAATLADLLDDVDELVRVSQLSAKTNKRIRDRFASGGPHLGAVRRWIQWTFRNGDRVTWGSDDELGGSGLTVRQMEELAEKVKDAVLAEVESTMTVRRRVTNE